MLSLIERKAAGETPQHVVILLHGFLGNKELMFDAYREAFPEDVRVIAIDLPFHGGSEKVAADGIPTATDLVLHTMRCAHVVDKYSLVGYSLGGRMALSIAAKAEPGSVESIVLISSDPGMEPDASLRSTRMERDRHHASAIRDDFPSFLRQWYAASLWGSSLSDSEKQNWIQRIQRINKAEAMAAAIVNFSPATMEDCWRFVLNSQCPPLLMVCGEEDSKYAKIASRIAGRHSCYVMPRAGHNVLMQFQRDVVSLTSQFIQQHHILQAQAIIDLQVQNFSLPLTRQMNVAGKADVNDRRGVLLRFVAESRVNGTMSGIGEASPLPGFHVDSLVQVEEFVKEWKKNFQSGSMRLSYLTRPLQLRSVQFAAEMAMFHMLAVDSKQDLTVVMRGILGIPSDEMIKSSVALNAVVPRVDAPGKFARQLLEKGYKTLKLKVGAKSIAEDIQVVKEITAELRTRGGFLRLDANQSWELEEAAQFVYGLSHLDLEVIEYIEEPLKNPENLPEFFRRTGLFYALDESLEQDFSWTNIQTKDGLAAYVAKPTVLGGIRETMRITQLGDPKAKIVLSSTFDSGIVLCYLVLFASILDGDHAHGLGTYDMLKEDLLNPEFSSLVENGNVPVRKCASYMANLEQRLARIDTFSRTCA